MKAFKCICSAGEFVVIATDMGNAKIVFSRNYPSWKIRNIEEIIESGIFKICNDN